MAKYLFNCIQADHWPTRIGVFRVAIVAMQLREAANPSPGGIFHAQVIAHRSVEALGLGPGVRSPGMSRGG